MEDFVICKICNEKCERIYGAHLKKHGLSSDDYKIMFPGEPLTCKKDAKETSKNSGKHMSQEKYKKMFSEMITGEKNPNHKSNTTEEERKSRSPFSENFINYQNDINKKETVSNFVKVALKDRVTTSQTKYWTDRGFSEEDSKLKISERQRTFTLQKCIEKYGEEAGRKRWLERQNIWQKSLLENGNIKCGYSMISQELFYEIIHYYPKNEKLENVFFATKNKEYFISKKGGGFFIFDFVDINSKKIIEYNGDLYHANPSIYNGNDHPHPYYKNNGPSSKETWTKDELKLNVAKENGFDILVIWDSEYQKNKKSTIEKCLKFLNI